MQQYKTRKFLILSCLYIFLNSNSSIFFQILPVLSVLIVGHLKSYLVEGKS